ncbi:hypothetical protein F5J12DRAFT_782389 [Pisolithus orientalis]|uniref:uncharacterized protein n=1 Tax=Pisolithus orientalis TaxID=936130 RepID=UPI00222588EC|nr:uncharacterized protein F5J12DRAFT_782389 [Pisolithus orientalis]KAI6008152.1 hypothetical protein F5J12DRAFT_782389 [Pisolithus orientalis]
MLVAEANSSGVRMCVKQDLDGRPEHLAGKRMMDKMMWGRRKLQWQMGMKGCNWNLNVWQYYLMGNKVVGSDSDNQSNLCQIPPTLPSNRNDGTGTSMVDEDAAEAVPLLDSQWQIARCQVAEGNTCQPIAISKEPSNALQQVEGGITSPVQPVPDTHHIDLPDSVHLADPLAVPTTIRRDHKQEDSKHKLPIPLMSQYLCCGH